MAEDFQIKRIKEANDIVEVVGSYVSLRQVGATYKGLCPFHDDRRPSFDVDPRRQRYRCWSCGKHGDVFIFLQEHERLTFPEAMEVLARRAGITLEKRPTSPQSQGRALMLELVKWAADQFHCCLLESPLAEPARKYIGERKLTSETVQRFGLGFAPATGDWLFQKAAQSGLSLDLLEMVGLIARRQEGGGYYDRFRDRIIFPIRDARGLIVGFGGRILPWSPAAARVPKYYNSSDTPLFTKSECLYGLDQARQAAAREGYLAVVEGYTDVLMAHQLGIQQVVATMGTALNARHVQNLRRTGVSRVVLLFDADEGGETGVDRALQIFVSQDVELAIASLPEGLDPCDLLVQQGPEPFRVALTNAVDALQFKMNRVLSREAATSIEGRRRAVDEILSVIALAPDMPGQAGAIKRELILSRIAQRLALKEETVWGRLNELKKKIKRRDHRAPFQQGTHDEVRQAPAAAEERELVEVLLAEPRLVAEAAAEVLPEEIQHPGLRRLLEGLYQLRAEGKEPDLDLLRSMIDNPQLIASALAMQERGLANPNRTAWLHQILAEFRQRRVRPHKQELQNQLHAVANHSQALELLRQLQNHSVGSESDA